LPSNPRRRPAIRAAFSQTHRYLFLTKRDKVRISSLGQLMIIAECTAEILKAPERDTPFVRAMNVWASWITMKDRQEAGGWSHPQDAKDFMNTGEAVEVMINDLPRLLWWAVRRSRGIATVWIFPEHSLLDAVGEAELILTPKMRNHLATRRYFV
jgi:hypothetical protein